MKDTITISEEAVKQIYQIIDKDNPYFRILIQGGGCSGFQYGLSFDDKINEDDTIISKNYNNKEVKFLIDAISLNYLIGATLDYKADINGNQFTLSNPAAETTCGCGNSFSF